MTPLFRKFLGMHWILFAITAALLAAGIYSIYAAVHFRDNELARKWSEQINWMLIGLVVYFAAALVDYKWVKWGSLLMYLVSIALVVALFSLGREENGQKLTLRLPGIGAFQPAQTAIASTILLMAVVLGEAHKLFPWMRHYMVRFLVSGAIFGVPFILMLKHGDLGSAMVIVPVAIVMLIVGNIPFRCLIATALIGLTVIPPVYFFGLKDYQRKRIDITLDMLQGKEVDVKGDAYAQTNNIIAVASAGWLGKGVDIKDLPPNMSNLTQLNKVPWRTSHNDFIFVVICETFGFRGAAALLGGFLFLLIMCLTVAFFARDALGRLIVTGIIALLFAHIFEHIGMNIGLLPVTGLPLPFISYGGTFLIMNLFLMGLLQSVWVHRNAMLEEEAAKQRPQLTPRMAPAMA
ncbi:MAG TPA: FtsW/RodA/SpoVE family cell cycle protein [Verrucomicrobiales bacterium]|jgi:rod shape determining protein RodA|nr:FtsW/RodA/SpoVE family cell cycle protein [Verrucomicrobiales bacterium]